MKFARKFLVSLLIAASILTGFEKLSLPQILTAKNTVKICNANTKNKVQKNKKDSKKSTKTNKKTKNKKNYVVYVTKTGHKYHRAGCRYLSRSCFKTTLSSAKAQGLTPCSVCRP